MLSVVIPTCDRLEMLEQCLLRLQPGSQTLQEVQYEVIVSDDSRNNSTQELINTRYPWVKWIKGPQKGPASNRNSGVQKASGEWILFVDDDCLPDPGWIQAYKEAIDGGVAKVYEGLTDADRPQQRFDEQSPINLSGGVLWSCNFGIDKQLFTSLGGFDENFPYPAMEDTDFHLRLSKVANIQFVSSAKVIHPWRKVKPFKGYRKWLASQKYFAKKHGGYGTFSFRYSRFKILISDLFHLSKELLHFSFKGTGFYCERIWFDVVMVFI